MDQQQDYKNNDVRYWITKLQFYTQNKKYTGTDFFICKQFVCKYIQTFVNKFYLS